MSSAAEAASSKPRQMESVLASGVDTISENQTIRFTRYVRLILPLDGFAFWVRADLLNPSAVFNDTVYNTATPNSFPDVATPAYYVDVKGSLHYTTDNTQSESEGYATNHVVFTAEEEIEALTDIAPKTMMIGQFDGLRFAFSRRSSLYRQADLYHYQGFAVYPAMETQIIDDISQINVKRLIVSNSLPIWLTLNKFVPMYPSYLVDDNIYPPWCSVHIGEDDTEALQSAPWISSTSSHYQLMKDRVRLSFYGLGNDEILDFQDYVNDYMVNYDSMGLMNVPAVRDDKRTQAEMNIIAQKKTMLYEVSYYQSRVNQIARQYIQSAFVQNFYPQKD